MLTSLVLCYFPKPKLRLTLAVLASRELNPYFAGGGSGMPTPAAEKAAAGGAVGKGDGGVAWLTKVKSTSKETIFRVLHHAG